MSTERTLEGFLAEVAMLKQDAQWREIKIQRQAAEIVRLKNELAAAVLLFTPEQMRAYDQSTLHGGPTP